MHESQNVKGSLLFLFVLFLLFFFFFHHGGENWNNERRNGTTNRYKEEAAGFIGVFGISSCIGGWMHAISNSEDVPCTKWPPARRSKGVEKRWYIRDATHRRWRVKVGPEGAIFVYFRYCRSIRVRGCVRRGGPQQDDSTGEVVVGGGSVVVRWWRV